MSLETGKITYNPYISIPAEKATSYGVSEKDIGKLDKDTNDKITLQEVKNAGLTKFMGLATHFNQETQGALFQKENISVKAQPVSEVKPVSFTHNTFNKQASLFNPEQRDNNNAELIGDPVKGKNIYLLA